MKGSESERGIKIGVNKKVGGWRLARGEVYCEARPAKQGCIPFYRERCAV